MSVVPPLGAGRRAMLLRLLVRAVGFGMVVGALWFVARGWLA